jgi:catechol 2,3-dioxygenase-like lactoylglutathione lyase family enzyme
MPGALYETHLQVRNLDESVAFYQKLGMKLAYRIENRNVAFFWFGPEREQMLGLWQSAPNQPVQPRHFAYRVTPEELAGAADWLRERGIEPQPAFGKEPVEPIVHAWMPAAALYFTDPDGNSLEFIALLDEPPQELNDILYWSEWRTLRSR